MNPRATCFFFFRFFLFELKYSFFIERVALDGLFSATSSLEGVSSLDTPRPPVVSGGISPARYPLFPFISVRSGVSVLPGSDPIRGRA